MGSITGKTPRVKYEKPGPASAPPAPPAAPGTTTRGYGSATGTAGTKKTPGDHAWLREWAGLEDSDETPLPARALPGGAPTAPEPKFSHRAPRAGDRSDYFPVYEPTAPKHRALLRDWFSEQDKAKAKIEGEKSAAAKPTTSPAQPKAAAAQPTTSPPRPAKPAQPPSPGNLPASKKTRRRRSSFQDSFLSQFSPGAPGRRRANLGRG